MLVSRMSKATNRFSSFQDAEDVEKMAAAASAAQKKQAAAKDANKKVVVKAPRQQAPTAGEGYEQVVDRPQTAGGRGRGGRGGRRDDDGEGRRGGRGGDRRGDGEGRRGGRGDGEGRRGGRGDGERRGGRGGDRAARGGGRGRPRTQGEDGQIETATGGGRPRRDRREEKDGAEHQGMDRRDGTGRGRRGDRKEGQGKGAWGGKKVSVEETKGEEEEKRAAPEEETKQAAQPEPEEEEEEVGFTLDDYFAQKQANSKGIMPAAAGGRKHEKIAEKVQTRDGDKQRVQAGKNELQGRDKYSIRPDVNANLLGFQSRDDDDFESRGRGGRGGRGRDQGPREQRQGGGRRRGGKLAVTDDDFPTL